MDTPRKRQFVHRHNRDGSFDSICAICFRTIANRDREFQLARDEHRHVCNDWDLDHSRVAENIIHQQTRRKA